MLEVWQEILKSEGPMAEQKERCSVCQGKGMIRQGLTLPCAACCGSGKSESKCNHDKYWRGIHGNCMACRAENAEQRCALAESKIEAARKALLAGEIQRRRSWWAQRSDWNGKERWIVCSNETEEAEDERGFGIPSVMARYGGDIGNFADPLDALIAADEYLKGRGE